MKAVMAGSLAWVIEISIVVFILFLVKWEETKVIKRRQK
jgi:hypothetical protein|tara:strand:- start:1066 stop:1182 length:117 start_codon:yes stop_codon:yes gene_type:complete